MPKPPTVHRDPPAPHRDKITLTEDPARVNLSLNQAIDYDKLTPTQQARWDAGMYGSIELKKIGIYHYYYARWRDPQNGKYRSTYLGKDYDKAIEKLAELTEREPI